MNVLLVEPDYDTRYPSLGLLKLASWHKQLGDRVQLDARCQAKVPSGRAEYTVTSSRHVVRRNRSGHAVTYYKSKFPRSEVWLGGIYASLLTSHAKRSGADVVWEGLMPEAEAVPPDYSLVRSWNASIMIATLRLSTKVWLLLSTSVRRTANYVR